MRLRLMLVLAYALVLPAQYNTPPGGRSGGGNSNPKQARSTYLGCAAPSDAILKAEYQKSLDDSRELYKLADSLKTEFEKNDPHIVSLATVKESEEIEKLSKRIRDRLKTCW